MRQGASGLAAWTVAGLALAGASIAAPGAPLRSGVYEGLELAVSPGGAVAGSFTRDADTLPHRICAFSFTGRLQPDGRASVQVRSPLPVAEARPIVGVLAAGGDGVTLNADGLTRYPACDQLAAADPKAGLDFSRTAPPDGDWIGVVVSTRAPLHLAPTGAAWRGYVVRDNYVSLGRRSGDRWQAVYLTPAGKRSRGWLDAADIHPLAGR